MSATPVPEIRPRRTRSTTAWRRLVAQTRLHPADLVLPMFVREGVSEPVPISSMPGVVQHTRDSLKAALHDAAHAGIGGVMLFGVPEHKDAIGSGADDPDGILNAATHVAAAEVGDALVVQTDLCLDEFTDHGHCGVLDGAGRVDNDASLDRYRSMALAQASAGSALLGLSRHDGRPGPRGARCAGRERTPGCRDPRLRGEVRICALRPVPRGRPVLARGRSPHVPARPGERTRGRARGIHRYRRGRRHRDGQARVARTWMCSRVWRRHPPCRSGPIRSVASTR